MKFSENIEKLRKFLFHKFVKDNPNKIKFVADDFLIDDTANIEEEVGIYLVDRDLVTPEFKSENKYQFRSNQNANNIRDIKEKFDLRKHFYSSGGFEGLPLVDKNFNVIVGNHRSEAIKSMNKKEYQNYLEGMAKKYPQLFKDNAPIVKNGMLVRVVKTNDLNELLRIAKVSNKGRLKSEGEKIYALTAQYENEIKELPKVVKSELELTNLIGANDIMEANKAVLGSLDNNIPKYMDMYEKKYPDDIDFRGMIYHNTYKFYNLEKALGEHGLTFGDILAQAIYSILHKSKNQKSNLQTFIDRFKNIDNNLVGYSTTELYGDLLAIGLRYFQELKGGGLEDLSKKLDDVLEFVNDDQPTLFGEKEPVTRLNVILKMIKLRSEMTLYNELINPLKEKGFVFDSINPIIEEFKRIINEIEI